MLSCIQNLNWNVFNSIHICFVSFYNHKHGSKISHFRVLETTGVLTLSKSLFPSADVVVQQIKLLIVMLPSNIGVPVSVLAAPFKGRFLLMCLRKQSKMAYMFRFQHPDRAQMGFLTLSFGLSYPWLLWPLGAWSSGWKVSMCIYLLSTLYLFFWCSNK